MKTVEILRMCPRCGGLIIKTEEWEFSDCCCSPEEEDDDEKD